MQPIMDQFCEAQVLEFLRKLQRHPDSLMFLQPIEEIIEKIPIYAETIKNPIDLQKIIKKFRNSQYTNLLEIKSDLDTMINNCFTFNTQSAFIIEKCNNFNEFYKTNWERLYTRIEIRNDKKKSYINQKRIKERDDFTIVSHPSNKQSIIEKNDNVAILIYEDEKIGIQIRKLFSDFNSYLDLTEETKENVIKNIIANISKRSKSFEQIYENSINFVMKHIKDTEMKSKFAKNFKKLLRSLEEEINEDNFKFDNRVMNIKIDLN
ncbi:MAG: hypothetical protein MJ252_26695, partial [archaeon]|nr:hypothetical protein [archaeon]